MNNATKITPRDHIQGDPHAFVTLLEYGDYECPNCGQAYLIVKRIQNELGGDVRFVFRNFPLRQTHPNAQMAAEAAEAAGAQGKFWEMHDELYENQQDLTTEDLVRYANEIDLDVEQFKSDLAERKFEKRVTEDFQSGVKAGVKLTPSFFINGEKYEHSWEYSELITAIRAELDQEVIGTRFNRPIKSEAQAHGRCGGQDESEQTNGDRFITE